MNLYKFNQYINVVACKNYPAQHYAMLHNNQQATNTANASNRILLIKQPDFSSSAATKSY